MELLAVPEARLRRQLLKVFTFGASGLPLKKVLGTPLAQDLSGGPGEAKRRARHRHRLCWVGQGGLPKVLSTVK